MCLLSVSKFSQSHVLDSKRKVPFLYHSGVTFFVSGFPCFFHFLFDHTVIPNNTIDTTLYFGHAVLASDITYFDIIALQNIDVSLYRIASNVT